MTFLVGAYATAPRPIESDRQFREYVDRVEAIEGVDGLEIPYQGPESPWNSLPYLADGAPGRRHVLTMAPGFVGGLAQDPVLGLASRDAGGRRRALDLLARARDWMGEVEAAGGAAFAALELQTSPPLGAASAEAFAESVAELAAWGWDGVQVLIEHCDAGDTGHEAAKGYLPLAAELAVARDSGLRMVLNWGRSAIETRSAAGAQAQLEEVAATGLLAGLFLSGVSDRETVHGPAWGDLHVPVRGWARGTPLADSELDHAAESSLLDRGAIAAALAAVPAEAFAGVKVAPPPAATPDERVEIVRAHVALIRATA